ncbi:transcriptional antitermination N peptide [Serratia liquefaciens]|uniref:transcriptional antitermination N peptide n=1 Tax=Serratia liquefaciens TaxID=614 RepID=UPI00061B6E96|nr:hypothetical protein [Serratia liquefaciens]AKE09180.1 hypothetical protein XJ20_04470 [Serratia liquefaciens]
MTAISYGKSVKPASKENAAARRHQRRAAEAIDRKLVESRICKALGQKPEEITRVNKSEASTKRNVSSRAELVTLTHFVKPVSSSDNRCLPEVAMFAAGFRKSEKITAR